ncbi:hypothetical protein FB45DRAFT_943178 [Roridomyces roridus]|uniref:Uncharacterized protein n=1 Tax=Roridomyces roridus TaxID=1738132 RepID=A0AAD7FBE4_9AGAR|nr:hypothetical protein FB45DRAFT_943178 [Roridomyces roridus]
MALPAASPSEHAPQSEGVVGVDVTRRPVSPAFSLQPRTVESELPSKSAGMASQSILVEDHIVPTALENGDVIPSASDVAVTNDVALPPGLIPVLPDTIAVDNVEPIPATDPIPASTPGTPTTIETFFSNVMDLDLSRYLPLFKSRGLGSMGILQTIAGWEHGAMKEMLKELLLVEGEGGVFTGPVGLSPIEVLSVERAIRKLGAGAGGQA